MFLPIDLPNEDAYQVSWATAADYMWNAGRSNPVGIARLRLYQAGYYPE